MSATPTKTATETPITDSKAIIHAFACPCDECVVKRSEAATLYCGIEESVTSKHMVFIPESVFNYIHSCSWTASNGLEIVASSVYVSDYLFNRLVLFRGDWCGKRVVLEELKAMRGATKLANEDFPRLKQALTELTEKLSVMKTKLEEPEAETKEAETKEAETKAETKTKLEEPICGARQVTKEEMVKKTTTQSTVVMPSRAYSFLARRWKASNGLRFYAGHTYTTEYNSNRGHTLYLGRKEWDGKRVVIEDLPNFSGKKSLILNFAQLSEALKELAEVIRKEDSPTSMDDSLWEGVDVF